jgi:hypothetical protein
MSECTCGEHWASVAGHAGSCPKATELHEVTAMSEETVTDGGRNPFYEGLFDGETLEQRAARLWYAHELERLRLSPTSESGPAA